MTSLLADIKPFEGHIVPGFIDPRFRAGPTVNLEGKSIHDVVAPTQKIEPKQGLGDSGLVKQLVNVLQKSELTAKMQEALPQYRSL